MPRLPDDASTPEERGRYAIFMMMLSRPWRDPAATVDQWSRVILPAGKIDAVWDSLFMEYLRWRREENIEVAWPYFRRNDVTHETPDYGKNPKEWWACLVFTRLLHMELVLSHRKSAKQTKPTEILGLPVEEIEPTTGACEPEGGGDGSTSEDNEDAADELCDMPDEPVSKRS